MKTKKRKKAKKYESNSEHGRQQRRVANVCFSCSELGRVGWVRLLHQKKEPTAEVNQLREFGKRWRSMKAVGKKVFPKKHDSKEMQKEERKVSVLCYMDRRGARRGIA